MYLPEAFFRVIDPIIYSVFFGPVLRRSGYLTLDRGLFMANLSFLRVCSPVYVRKFRMKCDVPRILILRISFIFALGELGLVPQVFLWY